MTSDEFDALWHALTKTQKQRVRDKANWEHMTLWAVLIEWPDIWKGDDTP